MKLSGEIWTRVKNPDVAIWIRKIKKLTNRYPMIEVRVVRIRISTKNSFLRSFFFAPSALYTLTS